MHLFSCTIIIRGSPPWPRPCSRDDMVLNRHGRNRSQTPDIRDPGALVPDDVHRLLVSLGGFSSGEEARRARELQSVFQLGQVSNDPCSVSVCPLLWMVDVGNRRDCSGGGERWATTTALADFWSGTSAVGDRMGPFISREVDPTVD